MDKLDAFIDDSRALIGKEATDIEPGRSTTKLGNIVELSRALGDDNPLYNDPAYAATTRYSCLIAHPVFLEVVRIPISEGPFHTKDYGLANLQTSVGFEWFDVIRAGDRLRSELKLTGVSEGTGEKSRRTAVLSSEASYWNRHGELVGKGWGEATMTPIKRGEEMLVERDIYSYSDEEIQQIEDDIESEVRRGSEPRYWEDVEVGDPLTPVVKGPMVYEDLSAWYLAQGKPIPMGLLNYKVLKLRPGDVRTHPATNWPYWDATMEPLDPWTSRFRGIPTDFDPGILRGCLATHLITNWMGDEGFLRKLDVRMPGYYLYGDTMWINGEVIDTYKEKIGGVKYGVVDIKIEGTNQLKEKILDGLATVYLPILGIEVPLPIKLV